MHSVAISQHDIDHLSRRLDTLADQLSGSERALLTLVFELAAEAIRSTAAGEGHTRLLARVSEQDTPVVINVPADRPRIRALFDMGGEPMPTRIMRRGDPFNPGPRVEAGVPSVLREGIVPYHVNKPSWTTDTSGYRLALAPERISLASVIRHVEGALAPVSCASERFYEKCSCPDEERCAIRSIMKEIRDAVVRVAERVTLAEMCERARKLQRVSLPPLDFVI